MYLRQLSARLSNVVIYHGQPKNLGKHVFALGAWHHGQVDGRTIHGGVLLCPRGALVNVDNRGSADLHHRLDQGNHDLELAARLEAIRLNDYVKVGEFLDFAPADTEYDKVFREAGLGQVQDNPQAVAARVKASHIGNALLAALDHWTTCTTDPLRRNWLLKVAALADPDATDWSARARDPNIRMYEAAFAKLLDKAPVGNQSAALLVALAQHWRAKGKDPVPFLKRVQQAHPSDFWANFWLGYTLAANNNPGEAVRNYQAALAVRRTANVCNNLGLALALSGRIEDGVEQLQRALEIEPSAVQVHYNLAIMLPAVGRYDEAIEQIQVALHSYPNAAILHTDFAQCLEKKDRLVEALPQHRLAVTLEPKRTEAQRELRYFLMRQGRVDEARVAWQAALEAKPTEHNAWYGYAELCLEANPGPRPGRLDLPRPAPGS